MKVTLRCPYATVTDSSPGQQGCEYEKPWTQNAQPSAQHGGALALTNEQAACPGCGRTGVADGERLVLVGVEG